MIGRKTLTTLTLCSFLLVSFLLIYCPPLAAEETTLFIDPQYTSGLNIGEIFQINVTIANVIDLYGWQFQLTYRNDALNATSITEGPFLKKDGASTFFWRVEFTDNYNETHGLIYATCTRTSIETGVNGTGVLATITFKVKALVSTILHLSETKLVDSASPFGNPIPHITVDGEVYAGFRDIAVLNVEVSATQVYVGQTVKVNVTVKNNGDYAETFNVTAYYDSNVIGRQTVTNLPNGLELTLTFTWDTTGLEPHSNYTIKGEASIVPGETNLENNVFVDSVITLRSPPVFLIRIEEVTPCNQSGYPTTTFKAGSIAYFKTVINNTSFGSETLLVTVNVYDSSDTTLGVVSFKGKVLPGVSTFILGLPIPSTTALGYSTVYANAFTDWPYYGGVPYCPEISATFEIVSP